MITTIVRRYVGETRYLSKTERLPKKSELVNMIFKSDDLTFERNARMTEDTFNGIFDMMKDHSVFQNKVKCSQADPAEQLLVA